MTCPICGRPSASAVRPFCSRRCADLDLGRWVTGAYRIPPEEYYLPDPGLEPDELTAVRLLADTIRVEGLDPEGYLQKLGTASARRYSRTASCFASAPPASRPRRARRISTSG